MIGILVLQSCDTLMPTQFVVGVSSGVRLHMAESIGFSGDPAFIADPPRLQIAASVASGNAGEPPHPRSPLEKGKGRCLQKLAIKMDRCPLSLPTI